MLCSRSLAACANVYLVKMFSDNYGYVLEDRVTKFTAVVDPGEPQVMIDFLIQNKLSEHLKMVLCTHKHEDHSGGNVLFKKIFPQIEVITTKYEEIPGGTQLVGESDSILLGELKIDVIHVPCHTKGHINFIVSKSTTNDSCASETSTTTALAASDISVPETEAKMAPIIFTGDTLFVGGCGRFFEGILSTFLLDEKWTKNFAYH